MFIILGIIFKSIAGMIVLVVIATSAITFSGLQILRITYNCCESIFDLITMLIGMATAVHVLSEFYGLRTAGLNAQGRLSVKLIKKSLKPIFLPV